MGSMMSPTLAVDGDGLALAAGVAGGTRLRGALVQALSGTLDEGSPPQDAIHRPRLPRRPVSPREPGPRTRWRRRRRGRIRGDDPGRRLADRSARGDRRRRGCRTRGARLRAGRVPVPRGSGRTSRSTRRPHTRVARPGDLVTYRISGHQPRPRAGPRAAGVRPGAARPALRPIERRVCGAQRAADGAS